MWENADGAPHGKVRRRFSMEVRAVQEITPFDFNGHAVRVITIDGEPWWFASEVAGPKVLGFGNPRDAVATHVDGEDRNTVALADGTRGNPNVTIINESGLYALIFGSTLPSAKEFKRWVTGTVLPAIRKTGSYAVELAPVDDLALAKQIIKAIETDRARLAAIEQRQEAQDDQVESLAADVADLKELAPITSPVLLTLRDVAHALDPSGVIGQNKVAKILKDEGIIFKDHQSGWRIHQDWFKRGLGSDGYEQWQNGNGWSWVTKFTPRGVAEILRRLA
jgi:anti-repressor protein